MNQDFLFSLAQQHGTPLYAYDLDAVGCRVKALRTELPAHARLYQSFKANPLPALAREVRAHGGRAEVTSEGELRAAQEAGFTADELLFGGPAKTEAEIAAALRAGVRWFSCESWVDARRVSAGAVHAQLEAQVLLRVNPAEAPSAGLAMTGVESQFGFDEEALLAAAPPALSGIVLRGVHVYFGSQIASREALVENTRRAVRAAERVSTKLGFCCDVVNAGGGFPWPYGNDGAQTDLTGMRAELDAVWLASPFSAHAELWFESGRYLVASSGTLVTRVMDVKISRTKRYVVLDTGIHHLGGMSGLGRLPRGGMAFHNLTRGAAGDVALCDVVGPLCSPLDSFARGITLHETRPDDLLAIPNVGAYGLTASLVGFLSHEAPVEIAHRGAEIVNVLRLRTGHVTD